MHQASGGDHLQQSLPHDHSSNIVSQILHAQVLQPNNFNFPCEHSNCLIAAIRGFRNGLYYGGKVRLAHAIVMAILFQSGVSPLQKLKNAIKLAWMHGRNLGSFVFVYKIAQCVLQQVFKRHHPIFSFIAGVIGAYVIWRDKNSINQ